MLLYILKSIMFIASLCSSRVVNWHLTSNSLLDLRLLKDNLRVTVLTFLVLQWLKTREWVEKKPWFALMSFVLLNVLGHDLVRQVKNCSKPQALRAIPSLMLKVTATGQIICDIIIDSNVSEGPEVLIRDQDLMMLVKEQKNSPLSPGICCHICSLGCTYSILWVVWLQQRKRDQEWMYWVCNTGTKRQTIMFNVGGSRENKLVSLSLAGLLYEQPSCRAVHKMNTLKLCRFYRELLSGWWAAWEEGSGAVA